MLHVGPAYGLVAEGGEEDVDAEFRYVPLVGRRKGVDRSRAAERKACASA